jgi:NTE family protein
MITANMVLSGGGARGVAHLGVLKALEEYGIKPNAISGTSAGSIVGAFLCDGFSVDETIAIIKKVVIKNKINFTGLRTGLLSMLPIENLLKNNLRTKNIEDLAIPFYATAANFNNGKAQIFSEGSIIERVLASCSIPIVFSPVFINNIPYVDGGLCSNLPVEPFYESKEKIIGVDVNPVSEYSNGLGFIANMERTINLVIKENTLANSKRCDVFIEPQGLQKFYMFDSKHIPNIIDIGYNYVKQNIPKESIIEKL